MKKGCALPQWRWRIHYPALKVDLPEKLCMPDTCMGSLLWNTFCLKEKLSKTAQSSNYNPDSFKILSWFECYTGDPVTATLLLALLNAK